MLLAIAEIPIFFFFLMCGCVLNFWKVFKETEDNDNKPDMLSLIVYTTMGKCEPEGFFDCVSKVIHLVSKYFSRCHNITGHKVGIRIWVKSIFWSEGYWTKVKTTTLLLCFLACFHYVLHTCTRTQLIISHEMFWMIVN